jgi:hypothetical protein
MQRSRRHNPYPLTWEIPLAVACTVLLALVLGVHIGRGIANLAAGAGWLWPDSTWLFRSVPAVLAGDATAGIHTRGPVAVPAGLRVWLVVAEFAVVVLLALVGTFVVRRWGPNRLKGMASPDETERLLGVSRLRRARQLIRPDLQPTAKTTLIRQGRR